jgi:hypothetical protein
MDLIAQEWYESLIGECKSILVEFGFRSNIERVRMYHELGSRILIDNHNFKRSEIYGEHITQKISKELGVGERTVQYAVAFAVKYPQIDWESGELGGLPHGKAITWSKVVHDLLPEGEKKEKPEKRCPHCGGLL